jgi:DNA-damage-inducible protein D
MENSNALTPFEGKGIRKIWHEEQWFFSVIDIIAFLTDSPKPSNYWDTMKRRDPQISAVCGKLKMQGVDGKNYQTAVANTEGVLRIVMSVPSPKAEPLKMWLAEQGKRAIDEAENPELLTERQAELYKAKGYSDEWIKERITTIQTRIRLTDEWQKRGIKESREYSILTATIAKSTFGLTPTEHAQHKGLDKQNLRDHMTPLELIFTSLSEEVTRQVAINDDAQGFLENHDAAVQGGSYTKKAMDLLEKERKIKVLSKDNFLGLTGIDKPKELPKGDKTD